MAIKISVWDMILKVVIAVASAIAGVIGANAMPLLKRDSHIFFNPADSEVWDLQAFKSIFQTKKLHD